MAPITVIGLELTAKRHPIDLVGKRHGDETLNLNYSRVLQDKAVFPSRLNRAHCLDAGGRVARAARNVHHSENRQVSKLVVKDELNHVSDHVVVAQVELIETTALQASRYGVVCRRIARGDLADADSGSLLVETL